MFGKVGKDTVITIFSRSAIVLINLVIVMCITRFWGAEGKGYQALFIANLGLISIVTNIFTNSSISYFVRKVGASKLYAQACIWTFISSILGIIVCYYLDRSSYLYLLLITCILTGYMTFHNALYIGMQKIRYYNLLAILQPLFLLILILLLQTFKTTSYFDYFYAYIISLVLVIAIAHFLTKKVVGKIKLQLDFSVTKQSFNYGFQNELSNFLQFLASRMGYYFIVYYLSEASLGIFSVGVAISESVWIFSRSISMVQYSKIIKEGNTQNARKGVVVASLFSISFSLLSVVILLLLPKTFFGYLFGNEFIEIKQIILLMSPGILCTAFSTVYGHYFAAIGKLKIQVLKSLIGVVLTLLLSILLIPIWKMDGACVANSIMRFGSAIVVIVYFIVLKGKD